MREDTTTRQLGVVQVPQLVSTTQTDSRMSFNKLYDQLRSCAPKHWQPHFLAYSETSARLQSLAQQKDEAAMQHSAHTFFTALVAQLDNADR